MTAAQPPADLLKPPSPPLGQRAFDIILWGGILVLLGRTWGFDPKAPPQWVPIEAELATE